MHNFYSYVQLIAIFDNITDITFYLLKTRQWRVLLANSRKSKIHALKPHLSFLLIYQSGHQVALINNTFLHFFLYIYSDKISKLSNISD